MDENEEPEYKFPATWTETNEFRQADKNLHAAQVTMRVISPCRQFPDVYAPKTAEEAKYEKGRPNPNRPLSTSPYSLRVKKAAALCEDVCPVLAECRELLRASRPHAPYPAITGVLAGYLIAYDGAATRAAIGMTYPAGG